MSDAYGKNWNPASHYKNDHIAEDYDRQRFSGLAGRIFNAVEKSLIRRAFSDLPKTSVIVDVPCGTGRLAEVILTQGFCLTGVDISTSMLAVAQRRLDRFGERFRTQSMDARDLPRSGMTFDAALCARVLMHFPLTEQITFLRGVTKITRQRVVFTQGLNTPWHRMRRRLKRLLRNQAPAVYPLRPAELRALMDAAGLREVRRWRLMPLLSESIVIVAEPI